MKLLQVIPNPYKMLDGNGKPTAITPAITNMPQANSSARPKRSTSRKKPSSSTSKASAACVPKLPNSTDPRRCSLFVRAVDVPADGEIGAYYKRGIKTGAIIPANKGNSSRAASRSSR